MAEAAHFPSPGAVGMWGWIGVCAYLLGIIGWEVVKTVRYGRRERALTEEFRAETERVRREQQQLTEQARREANQA